MRLSMLLWLASVLPQHAADQTCLATTLYLEARSQSVLGQMAVAEVALRRLEQGNWGNTVCSVVEAPHQFATTTTPASFDLNNLNAFAKAWAIAGKSISNWKLPADERQLVVPRADHFASVDITPPWPHKHGLRIGDHRFYALN